VIPPHSERRRQIWCAIEGCGRLSGHHSGLRNHPASVRSPPRKTVRRRARVKARGQSSAVSCPRCSEWARRIGVNEVGLRIALALDRLDGLVDSILQELKAVARNDLGVAVALSL